jgi:hypothetical protein
VGLRSIAASGPDLGEAVDGVVGVGHERATINELGDDAVPTFTREPREVWTGPPGGSTLAHRRGGYRLGQRLVCGSVHLISPTAIAASR